MHLINKVVTHIKFDAYKLVKIWLFNRLSCKVNPEYYLTKIIAYRLTCVVNFRCLVIQCYLPLKGFWLQYPEDLRYQK